MTAWDRWIGSESDSIRAAGQWRQLRTLDGLGPQFQLGERTVVSFASNDYLGLASHPAVVAAAHEALDRWGTGAGSSRLVVGDRPAHAGLESDIASWRNCEAALVFPTGYQANLAVMTTFGAGARIVSDSLNHASIIDGARLARGEVAIFAHGDIDQAGEMVAKAPGRCIVVSDTIFSMDGDSADLLALSDLCARSHALLVLDDAHSVFEMADVDAGVACIRVGTLSKALGSQGGYVAGSRACIDFLINRARSFIFTTGLAPAAAAGAAAAIGVCRSPEGDVLRRVLRGHVDAVRMGHPSPIVPVVVGEEADALAASDRLLEQGLLVPAIRPPTVPVGTSRLRVSLSAAHAGEDVARLAKALAQI